MIRIATRTILGLAGAVLCLAPGLAQGVRSGIAISPAGVDAAGRRTYNVQADSAELSSLLKELFRLSGDQFSIDQDVAGPVDLKLQNANLDQVFREVARLARPPIKIARQGALYRVSREFDAAAAARSLRDRVNDGLVDGLRPPASPNAGAYQALAPANRPVTLDVPSDRKIPLADALARISAQANYAVRLDRRVPREIAFSGAITRAPLGMVLQYIAEVSDLKVLWESGQALLVPTDRFQLHVGELLLGQHPSAACSRCGQRLFTDWAYCPRCGQPTARAARPPARAQRLRHR